MLISTRNQPRLESDLNRVLTKLKKEREAPKSFRLPFVTDFYGVYKDKFELLRQNLEQVCEAYHAEIDFYIQGVVERQNRLFVPFLIEERENPAPKIGQILQSINHLIAENNERSKSLAQDQRDARRILRLHEIASYIAEIDLAAEDAGIATRKQQAEAATAIVSARSRLIKEHEILIAELQIQLKDERKGAERVNDLLGSYFGHKGLKLAATEDHQEPGVRFQIMRGNNLANNMSEGERSLVAFCYFMAKLEDADTKGRELFLFIDDPVSSLDANHVFFVFSLIENLIAVPAGNDGGYSQLFISTHNLEFLKYLQKLSKPKTGGKEFFCIEADKRGSKVKSMPRYLKQYVTEFNYLFHQIYKCSAADPGEEHDCFYNFGNNLRKFLEAYLFYRYPCNYEGEGSHAVRMRKFFGIGNESVALTSRLTNEYSHLESMFDRSMRPVEVPEIPKLATYVLETIRAKDPEQYEALLSSIGGEELALATAA